MRQRSRPLPSRPRPSGPAPGVTHRSLVGLTGGVLLARGLSFEVLDAVKRYDGTFHRNDAIAYSPLCITLGASCLRRLQGA